MSQKHSSSTYQVLNVHEAEDEFHQYCVGGVHDGSGRWVVAFKQILHQLLLV